MEMCPQILDPSILRQIRYVQREEITVHEIYLQIAFAMGNSHNGDVLKRIASEELEHYKFWKKYSSSDITPDGFRVLIIFFIFKGARFYFYIKIPGIPACS